MICDMYIFRNIILFQLPRFYEFFRLFSHFFWVIGIYVFPSVNFTLFSRLPSASCSSHYFFLLSIGKHLQKVKFPTHHFLMLLAWLLLLLIFLPCLVVFLVFLRCPTPYPSDSPMFQTTLVIIHVHAVLEFIMPTSAKLSFQAVTFHFTSY